MYCLCNHPESAHVLVTDDIVRCQHCACDHFEADPTYTPPAPDPEDDTGAARFFAEDR